MISHDSDEQYDKLKADFEKLSQNNKDLEKKFSQIVMEINILRQLKEETLLLEEKYEVEVESLKANYRTLKVTFVKILFNIN